MLLCGPAQHVAAVALCTGVTAQEEVGSADSACALHSAPCRFDRFLVLMLPALEHAVRRVFACVNGCPERSITAEVCVCVCVCVCAHHSPPPHL